MPKKVHPADLHAADQIKCAHRFAAVLFPGREHGYITRYANTVEEARAVGKELEAAFPNCGRRALITAISPEGNSYPLPPEEPKR